MTWQFIATNTLCAFVTHWFFHFHVSNIILHTLFSVALYVRLFFGGVGNRIGSGDEFFMYLQAEKERKKKWEKKIIIYNPKEHDFITPMSHFLSEALLNVMRHVKNSCIYISLSMICLLFKMRWTSRLCFHINFCVLNRTNLGKPYPQLASLCRILITGTIVTWLKSC